MEKSDRDLLLVGRAWRAHGVKGELKVIPETDDPERLSDLRAVYVGSSAETAAPRDLEAVRYQTTRKGVVLVLKLSGVETREDAEELRKLKIFADRVDLPPLEEDEFFLHDLIGLRVFSDEGAEIGDVTEVLELPAHDVLVVDRGSDGTAMIPVVSEFVEEIDLEQGRIVIRPIEGLLE